MRRVHRQKSTPNIKATIKSELKLKQNHSTTIMEKEETTQSSVNEEIKNLNSGKPTQGN